MNFTNFFENQDDFLNQSNHDDFKQFNDWNEKSICQQSNNIDDNFFTNDIQFQNNEIQEHDQFNNQSNFGNFQFSNIDNSVIDNNKSEFFDFNQYSNTKQNNENQFFEFTQDQENISDQYQQNFCSFNPLQSIQQNNESFNFEPQKSILQQQNNESLNFSFLSNKNSSKKRLSPIKNNYFKKTPFYKNSEIQEKPIIKFEIQKSNFKFDFNNKKDLKKEQEPKFEAKQLEIKQDFQESNKKINLDNHVQIKNNILDQSFNKLNDQNKSIFKINDNPNKFNLNLPLNIKLKPIKINDNLNYKRLNLNVDSQNKNIKQLNNDEIKNQNQNQGLISNRTSLATTIQSNNKSESEFKLDFSLTKTKQKINLESDKIQQQVQLKKKLDFNSILGQNIIKNEDIKNKENIINTNKFNLNVNNNKNLFQIHKQFSNISILPTKPVTPLNKNNEGIKQKEDENLSKIAQGQNILLFKLNLNEIENKCIQTTKKQIQLMNQLLDTSHEQINLNKRIDNLFIQKQIRIPHKE